MKKIYPILIYPKLQVNLPDIFWAGKIHIIIHYILITLYSVYVMLWISHDINPRIIRLWTYKDLCRTVLPITIVGGKQSKMAVNDILWSVFETCLICQRMDYERSRSMTRKSAIVDNLCVLSSQIYRYRVVICDYIRKHEWLNLHRCEELKFCKTRLYPIIYIII